MFSVNFANAGFFCYKLGAEVIIVGTAPQTISVEEIVSPWMV